MDALKSFSSYIFISSSAVYPEYLPLPFKEDMPIGENKIWGFYGKGKVEAEKALLLRVPDAFIIRPPYLYGPMNNVYREAFVFDCAIKGRKFFLPQDGNLKLKFFYNCIHFLLQVLLLFFHFDKKDIQKYLTYHIYLEIK